MSTPAAPRRRWFRRLSRACLWSLAALLLLIGLYFGGAVGLAAISIGGEAQDATDPVEIAIYVGPAHTDVVMPVTNAVQDWRAWLRAAAFAGDTTNFTHVAIGWGDRGFYLETPQWSDLKIATALTAVSGLGQAATHVEFMAAPALHEATADFHMVPVTIDAAHYRRLVEFVQSVFVRDDAGHPQAIPAHGYWYDGRDAFFEANGSYSLFRTCNVWTCEALRAAGLPRPLWSPFPGGVTRHLPPPK